MNRKDCLLFETAPVKPSVSKPADTQRQIPARLYFPGTEIPSRLPAVKTMLSAVITVLSGVRSLPAVIKTMLPVIKTTLSAVITMMSAVITVISGVRIVSAAVKGQPCTILFHLFDFSTRLFASCTLSAPCRIKAICRKNRFRKRNSPDKPIRTTHRAPRKGGTAAFQTELRVFCPVRRDKKAMFRV